MDYRDNRPATRKGGPYCTPIWGPGSTPIYTPGLRRAVAQNRTAFVDLAPGIQRPIGYMDQQHLVERAPHHGYASQLFSLSPQVRPGGWSRNVRPRLGKTPNVPPASPNFAPDRCVRGWTMPGRSSCSIIWRFDGQIRGKTGRGSNISDARLQMLVATSSMPTSCSSSLGGVRRVSQAPKGAATRPPIRMPVATLVNCMP